MPINVTSKPLTAVQSMFLYCCLVVVIVYPRCELFELCPGKILTQRFAQQTLDKERANNCHPFQLRILDNNQRGSRFICLPSADIDYIQHLVFPVTMHRGFTIKSWLKAEHNYY